MLETDVQIQPRAEVKARVERSMADAIDAAIKERAIKKNDFMISAIQRELDSKNTPDHPSIIGNEDKDHACGEIDALILEVVCTTFKYLLPLRDDMEIPEAEKIKDLFLRCRSVISERKSGI